MASGIPIGKERVQNLTQLCDVKERGKRRFKGATGSNRHLPISPNLINRKFTLEEPTRVWASDITCIATIVGWRFLTVVTDRFSHHAEGWSLRGDMTSKLAIDALRLAWFRRYLDKQARLLFRSDRGSHYVSCSSEDAL